MGALGAREALFSVLLGVIIWLAISSASVLVLASGAPGEVCALWRLFYASILLLPLRLTRGGRPRIWHVISGLALSLHFVLWMRSLYLIPVYYSTLLVALYPLYSLFVDALVHKARVRAAEAALMMTALLLLALFLGVNKLWLNEGGIMALLAGVLAMIYFEIGSYCRFRLGEDLVTYSFNTYSFAAIATLAYNVINSSPFISASPYQHLAFIAMALLPMLMGHTLMNYMLKSSPAYVVSAISLGEPFGSGLLAYMFFGQSLPLHSVLMGFGILASVFGILWHRARAP